MILFFLKTEEDKELDKRMILNDIQYPFSKLSEFTLSSTLSPQTIVIRAPATTRRVIPTGRRPSLQTGKMSLPLHNHNFRLTNLPQKS